LAAISGIGGASATNDDPEYGSLFVHVNACSRERVNVSTALSNSPYKPISAASLLRTSSRIPAGTFPA
jgi:hypothetical protein